VYTKVLIFLLFFSALAENGVASQGKGEPLSFDIPVVAGVDRYLDFLSSPSYLVVALQNNGVNASNMGRPNLIDAQTVQMNLVRLAFVNAHDDLYSYDVALEWQSPIKTFHFNIPMEIDTKKIKTGSVRVNFYIPFASQFPEALLDRLRIRISFFSDPEFQEVVISYLDTLAGTVDSTVGFQGLVDTLMLQSFSSGVQVATDCVVSEPGDSEPLSEQWALIITLAIWLIIMPVGLLVRYLWIRSKKNDVGL